MATLPPPRRWLHDPLTGSPLILAAATVLLAGALYCSGYERLSTGLDNWPGSLWWSLVAVMPWFALVEWAKRPSGRRRLAGPSRLALALIAVAAFSIAVEVGANALAGQASAPILLLVMRRLPAIAAALLLILLARGTIAGAATRSEPIGLAEQAATIDWVAAADNYVELHRGETTSLRRGTLAQAAIELEPHGFVRIHRRYLVKRGMIARVTRSHVWIRGGPTLPVGAAYAARIVPPA